jgi:hypothetical protein
VFRFSSLNRDEAEDGGTEKEEEGKKKSERAKATLHGLKTRKVNLIKRETAQVFGAALSGTRKRFTIERDAAEERPEKFSKDH